MSELKEIKSTKEINSLCELIWNILKTGFFSKYIEAS